MPRHGRRGPRVSPREPAARSSHNRGPLMLRLPAAMSLFVLAIAACAAPTTSSPPRTRPNAPPPAYVPDAPAGPMHFTARLTNVAPWTVLKSGVVDVPVGKVAAGPLHGGDAYEVTFTSGKAHRVSFAMM